MVENPTVGQKYWSAFSVRETSAPWQGVYTKHPMFDTEYVLIGVDNPEDYIFITSNEVLYASREEAKTVLIISIKEEIEYSYNEVRELEEDLAELENE